MSSDAQMFCYIGYGSLINHYTRPSADRLAPIYLSGFQREWSFRNEHGYARITALNVTPKAESSIAAVLAVEPMHALHSLDEREMGYNRTLIDTSLITAVHETDAAWVDEMRERPLYIYQAKPENHHLANEDYPILQSYLDVVMDGLIRTFSLTEAARFVREAVGMDRTIINDRAAPIYPRALNYEPSRLREIDEILAQYR